MKKNAKKLTLHIVALVVALAFCSDIAAQEVPVFCEYLACRDGIPPGKIYSVRLVLKNNFEKPIWFLMPYWADSKLPRQGVFVNKRWSQQPFEGRLFKGDAGSIVEVRLTDDEGFRAFNLPARGQLELDGYCLDATHSTDSIVVLQATSLLVNKKIPLENWLPYRTLSSPKVKSNRDQIRIEWKNLDWDTDLRRRREDYRSERIEEIRAEGCRSWTIKLQRSGDR
jgi:hypothetical protein